MTAPRFSRDDVRRYYDANTPRFIRHGQGGHLGTIHRAVWGPGVRDRAAAFRYVDALIIREIDALGVPHPVVLDLGCGIGASLAHIARERPVRGIGVTLSRLQARVGTARIAAAGLADRVCLVEGDFCALPVGVATADLAYAIDSFVHGPAPERFFADAARAIRPGGRLVICDDVRTDGGDARAAGTLRQFARGWHVNALLTPEALERHAARAGFRLASRTDLTPWLELRRPRDRAVALLAAIAGRMPRLPSGLAPLIGGAALQRGLARGWIAYHCAVFTRT